MTTSEALAVVRSALEEVTPCGCPKGMKYHALNCGVAPGELQALAALALIEERMNRLEEEAAQARGWDGWPVPEGMRVTRDAGAATGAEVTREDTRCVR